MKGIVACLFNVLMVVKSDDYHNVTYEPAQRQLLDFKEEHQYPIGLWTKNNGDPVDIRDTVTINSDQFSNQLFIDTFTTTVGERIPERIATAKGTGAFGYFEVTKDISKYTYADVFNGVGKKTPVVVRFATAFQNKGGSELVRDLKTMAVKFYTKQGNLDILALSIPIFAFKDPMLSRDINHAFKRNPQTNLYDFTSVYDLATLRPSFGHALFWVMSDYGIPDGYRRMDAFPIHTYELSNKHGETHYVRFNFRTDLGFSYLTTAQAAAIQAVDLDYYTRDLYNAIDSGKYPSWTLEMDVMTIHDLEKVHYDPFDITRLWKNGTFHTVPIGRLVLNRNVENYFRDIEQAAFDPAHLVPGIPGPIDYLFRGRRMVYKDGRNYRLGRNNEKILVNMPLHSKTYVRDGRPPVWLNMKNAPNYYPNSFHGPVSYVDEHRPLKKLQILQSNAVDLEPMWYFYNYILEDEAHKQRFIDNIVLSLVPVTPPVIQRTLKLLFLVDQSLGERVKAAYEVAVATQQAERIAAPHKTVSFRRVPSSETHVKHEPK